MRAAVLSAFAFALCVAGPPARAEPGYRETARAEDAIAERAEAVRRHFAKLGFAVRFGAAEAGATQEGLVLRAIEFEAPGGGRVHRIARIEIRKIDWSDPEHPRFASFSVAGLAVSSEALGGLGAALGLAAISVDLDVDYHFDEAAKTFEITRGRLDVAELGEARFRLKIADLAYADYRHFATQERRGADYEAAAGRLAMASLAGASISFKDRALVERLVRQRARTKGVSEDAARAQLVDALAAERRKAEDPSLREVLDAVATFLAGRGEISFAADPQPGISLLMLTLLLRNPAVLRLSVSVK
jgi:hypothetical protein